MNSTFLHRRCPLSKATRARLKGERTPEHVALRKALSGCGSLGARVLARLLLCERNKGASCLTLEWRRSAAAAAAAPTTAREREIVISQSGDIAGGNVGAVVWDCAALLYSLIEDGILDVTGRSVMELGSGAGLVGIAAARAGARRVVLTDAHNLDELRVNVAANVRLDEGTESDDGCLPRGEPTTSGGGSGTDAASARVARLDWDEALASVSSGSVAAADAAFPAPLLRAHFDGVAPEIVLASDVLYSRGGSAAFVALLERLVAPQNVRTRVVLAYKHRHAQTLDAAWTRLHASFEVTQLRGGVLDAVREHCHVACYTIARRRGGLG